MILSDLAAKWEGFLRDRFGVACSVHSRLSLFPSVSWPYPAESCYLVADGVNAGCVFSMADSKDATEGIIERHGFIAIGGSSRGSMLMVKVAGDGSEIGFCRWIAPGFEERDDCDWDMITYQLVADPVGVFSEILETRGRYYDDIAFDDPEWNEERHRGQ